MTSPRETHLGQSKAAIVDWTDETLGQLEQQHPEGIGVQQVVDAFARRGHRLTEATFRKYVQLGLLPRSVRVGRKGKHRGSQGLYPASVIRQIEQLRRLMAQGYTIDEIQRNFLFVGSEIEGIRQRADRIFTAFAAFQAEHESRGTADVLLAREVAEAQALATSLVEHLHSIERRLAVQARMARAAV